ncbi:hypothetical protein NQ318_002309 [Aromia moschata]|uniref:FYVE zinc finger domain-containing protein n=1 Tax=Aromia moschata TaxID=1265417 RepID=A0AAV8Z365_9CUCU|nr:hypothetical protein NQ318_002309 [Aromia moschata]
MKHVRKLSVLASELPQEPNAPIQDALNGHQTDADLRQPDFYPSDQEDVDCKQDCLMFKGDPDNLTDDQIDGLDQGTFDKPPSGAKSDSAAPRVHMSVGGQTERIPSDMSALATSDLVESVPNGDANRECENGDGAEEAGDNVIACGSAADAFLDVERSVETSTETLVSEHVCSSSPKEINGFEKVQSPIDISDMTDGCAQDLKFSKGADSNHFGTDKTSAYSSSPFFINGSNMWENGLHNLSQQKNFHSYQYTLGEDGLIPLRCVVQERLDHIIEEQKRKVDLLEKELHLTRQNLIRQSCHRCNHIDGDRQDDNVTGILQVFWGKCVITKGMTDFNILTIFESSVIESVCSTGEGQASVGESQRSDMSWVAVEEASPGRLPHTTYYAELQLDLATSRFPLRRGGWVGQNTARLSVLIFRKCGKIFCADCSENSTPLPSEQLYNPVRVCTGCYSELRRNCGEIPNQCKHANTQTTNTNPQIAASSN